MATLKEQCNQSPTIEACNSDIINLVTQMEQLKMTLKQADDEFNSLEHRVSVQGVKSLGGHFACLCKEVLCSCPWFMPGV